MAVDGKELAPYEATVTQIVDSDTGFTGWLFDIFPNLIASQSQLEEVRLNIAGILHEGLMMGFDLSGEGHIGQIIAYQKGFREGHEIGYMEGLDQ